MCVAHSVLLCIMPAKYFVVCSPYSLGPTGRLFGINPENVMNKNRDDRIKLAAYFMRNLFEERQSECPHKPAFNTFQPQEDAKKRSFFRFLESEPFNGLRVVRTNGATKKRQSFKFQFDSYNHKLCTIHTCMGSIR